jgi:glutathione synthase/RimK-type ligase-like ATP-grasp enzyme
MKRVLIISHVSEFNYFGPFLRAAETHGGLDVVVFDTNRFPSESAMSVCMDNRGGIDGSLEVSRFDARGAFAVESVPIRSIEVAWNLRARPPRTKRNRIWTHSLAKRRNSRFSASESAHALRSLRSVAPWRWINSHQAVQFAENNKLYQQMIAAECGLEVPETVASNDPKVVQEFAAKDGKILAKLFGYSPVIPDGYACYSSIFREDELRRNSRAIALCPLYCQRYIEKVHEYRVMVIGNEVLACRIDSQASDRTRVDWRRYDFKNVSHVMEKLPDDVEASLLRFMQRMNLRYGAIDLVKHPDGRFIFLEVNPSGQWEWIQYLAKLPIPEAVARMLAAA